MEPVSYAAVEEDGTSGLVIEVFDDLDKVGADGILLYGCPQSCIPNPVEGLLEVYGYMIEVLHGRGLAGARDISHREFVG